MAYFLQTHREHGNAEGFLIEMPAQHLAQRNRDFPTIFYSRISAKQAHRWVLDGGRHSTALYVDDGRIKRSKEVEFA